MLIDLYTRLNAVLSPLVPGLAHPEILPQALDVFPAIRYTFPFSTADDDSCGITDIDGFNVQIDVYSREHDALISLRDSVIAAVLGEFPHAERTGSFSAFEDDSRLYRRTLEFLIWFDN